ncbi:hypothetical protein PUN4_840068 [Paraburkholderia unamae]|nr:hypothetical protein PUN4_840068 [Paraburkholderia unamae]
MSIFRRFWAAWLWPGALRMSPRSTVSWGSRRRRRWTMSNKACGSMPWLPATSIRRYCRAEATTRKRRSPHSTRWAASPVQTRSWRRSCFSCPIKRALPLGKRGLWTAVTRRASACAAILAVTVDIDIPWFALRATSWSAYQSEQINTFDGEALVAPSPARRSHQRGISNSLGGATCENSYRHAGHRGLYAESC